MMAAARCAARRLGGYLLQPTQAAVAEEGRRLVTSRFMRSRQLSTKHACGTWMEKKMQKFRSMVAEHKVEMGKVRRESAEDAAFRRRVESYMSTIDSVVHGTAMIAFLCIVPFAVFAAVTKQGVEAEAVTEENQ